MSVDFAPAPTIKTARLVLRAWRADDLDHYAAMSVDPEVMRYLGGAMTREQSDGHVADIQDRFRKWGYFYWAVETPDNPFAGFVGLSQPHYEAHFTPAVEIGWRLARAAWGRGYASEAASACLAFGFARDDIDEIVAIASVHNAASLGVMRRIGMARNPADDFDFPGLPEHPDLRRSALCRIDRAAWTKRAEKPKLTVIDHNAA